MWCPRRATLSPDEVLKALSLAETRARVAWWEGPGQAQFRGHRRWGELDCESKGFFEDGDLAEFVTKRANAEGNVAKIKRLIADCARLQLPDWQLLSVSVDGWCRASPTQLPKVLEEAEGELAEAERRLEKALKDMTTAREELVELGPEPSELPVGASPEAEAWRAAKRSLDAYLSAKQR